MSVIIITEIICPENARKMLWDRYVKIKLENTIIAVKQQNLWYHIDGLAQDCSNYSALAMELLQSCSKPSIWHH